MVHYNDKATKRNDISSITSSSQNSNKLNIADAKYLIAEFIENYDVIIFPHIWD